MRLRDVVDGDRRILLALQDPQSVQGGPERRALVLGEQGHRETARAISWRLGELEGFLPLLERLGSRVHLAEIHEPLAAAAGMAALPAPTALGHCGWAPASADLATVRMEDAEGAARHGAPEVLHALVHLVHDGLLSDEQRRRLRDLYRRAVIDDRLPDARSAADEVEYLARGFEVHPGMNLPAVGESGVPTGDGLLRRDPGLVAFIEELLVGAGAAARGDPRFLRSNLAEMYTRLARQERLSRMIGRPGADRAATLLDSALVHDGAYGPALLEYARVEVERGRPDRAEEWLRVAEGAGAGQPAALAARADVLGGTHGGGSAAYDARASLLLRAIGLERDPVARAEHRRALWRLQRSAGRLPEAIGSVLEYLRDEAPATQREATLRLEAEAEMMALWLEAGHDEEGVGFFGERVAASPADPAARARYFDALLMSGDTVAAAASLAAGERLLRSAGIVHPRIALRSAELALATGDTSGARGGIERLLPLADELSLAEGHRLVRLLISAGESSEAQRRLALLPLSTEPASVAEAALSRGRIMEWRGDTREAERHYREAVALDPYGAEKRVTLHRFLVRGGRLAEADQLVAEAAALTIPLGSGFERQIGR